MDLYSEVILDLNRYPKNFGRIDHNRSSEADNPLCGDVVKIYVMLEGEMIKDVSFDGYGCALSKASASLLTELVKGKNLKEVKEILENFFKMVAKKEYNENILGKTTLFKGISSYPSRVKCITLCWHGLKDALFN